MSSYLKKKTLTANQDMYNRAYTPERITELRLVFGSNLAGFYAEEIAPLFKNAIDVENIILPREFINHLHYRPNDGLELVIMPIGLAHIHSRTNRTTTKTL